MANPRTTGRGAGPVSDPLPPDPPPPMDPDELKQIQMLAEAVLVSFSATPNPMPPYGKSKLQWQIVMPTTMIPGAPVEVHLFDGEGDQLIMPEGERTVQPYAEAEFAIYLKSPKAARHLGTLSVTVDTGSCEILPLPANFIISQAKAEAEKSFPDGGRVTLRDGGAKVDIGINSFVVDVPLTAAVNNWFDPDIDIKMGFSLWAENGQVRASNDLASTDVSPGWYSSLLSGGCASKVAEAVEATSDGYLEHFVGPEIAARMRDKVQANIDAYLKERNAGRAVRLKFYDMTLTQDGLTCRFCPETQRTIPTPHEPPIIRDEPIIIG